MLLIAAFVIFISCYGAYALPATGNHDEYIKGALQFYSLRITPSIEESQRYLSFTEHAWRKTRCFDKCYQAGFDVGHQYIAYNQRNTNEL